MPASALIPLLLTWGQGGLPTKAADFLGTFAQFDDLVSTTLKIKPKGIAEKSWRPDHAGEEDWTGTWKVEGGVLKMRLVSKTEKKVSHHEFIPIRWGDRLSLVPRDQIEDYARRELEDMPLVEAGRYGKQDRFSRFAYARVDNSFRPGKRYGTPIAPKEYQPLFKDLVFKGFKDPGETIPVPVGSQESWAEMDARAPKVPFTRVEMEEMIRIYRAYGLPLAPRSAMPYRVHQHLSDSPNSHEMDSLVFVNEANGGKGRCVYWGTRCLTLEELRHPKLSQDPVVEAVKLTDPWVLMPRRFIGRSDTN